MSPLDTNNALFYTFSTIPQTVGAAFAVLAAFVLYRLQVDNATRPDDIHQLMEWLATYARRPGHASDPESARTFLANNQDEQFVQLVERAGIPPKQDLAHLPYRRFARAVRDRPRVRRTLYAAFVLTSVVILYSLTVLCIAPWIATRAAAVAFGVLGTGVLGVLLCLRLYWGLIRLLLE
jgi:hypothetical protein